MNLLLPLKNEKLATAQVEAAIPYLMLGTNNVVLTHVIEPPILRTGRYDYDSMVEEWTREHEYFAKRLLERKANEIIDRFPAAKVTTLLLHGKIVERIVGIRFEKNADLIITAKGNTNWLFRLFEPSISSQLANKARCRMLTVQAEAQEQRARLRLVSQL